ncbi:hypothetical protein CPB85DRAFT_1312162 [Mucidula mucida]|nr:hypothetical protein CPB85DRAFT_1312162 [Mucidula mucida]
MHIWTVDTTGRFVIPRSITINRPSDHGVLRRMSNSEISSLSMDTQAHPQVLALIPVLQLVSYFEVSASALYLFDYLLTLSEEIEFIWHAKWNIIKILYLLTRYLPFVNIAVAMWSQFTPNMSLEDCLVSHRMSSWIIVLGISFAEVLLTLRTWAVWNRQPYLTLAMSALFIAVMISGLVVVALFCRSLQFVMLPIPDFRGCFQSAGSSVLLWDAALLTIYQGVMFLLVAVKAYQQSARETPAGSSQFLNAILKDGLIYYMYLAALSIMNIVLVRSLSQELVNTFSSLLGPAKIHAMLTCRTITNIRVRAKSQVIVGSSGDIDDLGTVSTFQVDSQSYS